MKGDPDMNGFISIKICRRNCKIKKHGRSQRKEETNTGTIRLEQRLHKGERK